MAEDTISGGCACGAVRYQVNSKAGFSFHCQCRDCQRMSGTGHASAFICKDADTTVTGDLSWYERNAPSGNIVRAGFCGTCGSPVMNHNSGYPENLFVTAGSLDDPSEFQPTKIVHRDESYAWDFMDMDSLN